MIALEEFLASDIFSPLDRHFARALLLASHAQSSTNTSLLGHAAALASAALRRGNVCLDLSRPPSFLESDTATLESWPSLSAWRQDLEASGVTAFDRNSFLPLVLDNKGRLYLHRYRQYEAELAEAIATRAAAGLLRLIVGGPGTGKTRRILQEMAELLVSNPAIRIALAAPTGKAATRMEESIDSGLAKMDIPPSIQQRIPRTASTLHRLLGTRGDSAFFRHHAGHPLPFDVVIIDEASMVDLPLMTKLFQAMAPSARLILLGDPDQLASVEAGAVLADIATAAQTTSAADGLKQSLITLDQQYRYGAHSGIGKLCDAIRRGDGDAALDILQSDLADVRLRPLPDRNALAVALRKNSGVQKVFDAMKNAEAASALRDLGKSRILCPMHHGTYGVVAVNEIMVELAADISLENTNPGLRRPIVVTRNDYALQIFNGDTGLAISNRNGGATQVFFSAHAGDVRSMPISRLPAHETAYAMTIHRSQGSEFDRVLIILPPTQSPLMTRELLYTAVSRARGDVEIWGDPDILRNICSRQVRRTSGLVDELIARGA